MGVRTLPEAHGHAMSTSRPDGPRAAGDADPEPDRACTPPGSRTRGDDTNEIVRGLRAGDEERFTELYERVAPALYAWLRLRLSPSTRRRLDPEDVVQEIWLRALRAFARFDPERGSFRGWIFQVAKYELLDTFRGLASAAGVQILEEAAAHGDASPAVSSDRPGAADAPFARLSQVPDEVTSFTRRIARDDDLHRLLAHVEALPDDDRALVVHCGLEGRPASETAVLLGLSHEATRKRWLRLRDSLRERAWVHALFADAG